MTGPIAVVTIEPGTDAPPNVEGWVYAALVNWAAKNGHVQCEKHGSTIRLFAA